MDRWPGSTLPYFAPNVTGPDPWAATGLCCYCHEVREGRQIVGHKHPDHVDDDHDCLIYWKCDGKKAP